MKKNIVPILLLLTAVAAYITSHTTVAALLLLLIVVGTISSYLSILLARGKVQRLLDTIANRDISTMHLTQEQEDDKQK